MDWNTASIQNRRRDFGSGAISSSALLEAHIATIEKVNPTVNGMVADRYARARSEAAVADERLQRDNIDLPALHGHPVHDQGVHRRGGSAADWRRALATGRGGDSGRDSRSAT